MDLHSYWRKQEPAKPLFPDIEWSKPERRDQAGRLGIIGGSSVGFRGVAASYQAALEAGAGSVRVLLPDTLRKTVPPVITDVLFAPATPSGSLGGDAFTEITALHAWSQTLLLAGDNGQNSETAVLYERIVHDLGSQIIVARDALDILLQSAELLASREQTIIIASFAQAQKLFRALYYPKMLIFSMQLSQLVETLHKFTISYPLTIVTLHSDQLIVAHGGEVVTQAFTTPMRIWSGELPGRIAAYAMWNPSKSLEAVITALQ